MKQPNPALRNLIWRDQVGGFLNDLGLVGEGVEIGSHDGAFALQVMSGSGKWWHHDPRWAWKGHLTCIDAWEHQPESVYVDSANLADMAAIYATAQRNLKPYKVTLLKAYSVDAAKQFADESLVWVYIDANHAYPAATEDRVAWWPKLKRGGLFSGHDFYTCYNDKHPDPLERTESDAATAVFALAAEIDTWPYVTACRSWWFIKP
jgi:hypothetical protein